MNIGLYILDGHEPVPVKRAGEWGEWFETAGSARVVKETQTEDGFLVSTVFMGIDYSFGRGGPPLLFETMLFLPQPPKGSGLSVAQRRCSTWLEAEALHEAMLAGLADILLELGPICRVCGCTEERACEGGCTWVAADLCSACVRPLQ